MVMFLQIIFILLKRVKTDVKMKRETLPLIKEI